MVRRARRRLPVDERRARLIEVGFKLFSRRHYATLSLDDIARAARISKGLLYHYFPNKRAFYAAVVGRAAAELLERARPAGAPSFAVLRASVEAYLAFVEERALAYALLLRGSDDRAVHRVLEHTRRAFADLALASLGIGAPSPLVRTAVRGWVGLVEAASLDWVEHGGVDRRALAGLLATAFVQLLGASGQEAPMLAR
jgi:AcrR family transcriptional regulator